MSSSLIIYYSSLKLLTLRTIEAIIYRIKDLRSYASEKSVIYEILDRI